MKKILIHAGFGKTGTTSLQHFLAINKTLLSKNNIFYSEVLKAQDDSHHLLSFSILHEDQSNSVHGEKNISILLKKFEKEVSQCAEDSTIIISSELLIPAFSKKGFQEFLNCIKGLFKENINIVFYIRRQDQYLESLYYQFVKEGREWVKNKSLLEFSLQQDANYLQTLNAWAKVFGQENILLRVLEKDKLSGGTIFSDFLSLLNISLTEEYSFPSSELANKTFNRDLRSFYEIMHNSDYITVTQLNDIYLKDQRFFNEKNNPSMPPNLKRRIIKKYQVPNQKIAKIYFNIDSESLFDSSDINRQEDFQPMKKNGAMVSPIIMNSVLKNFYAIEELGKKMLPDHKVEAQDRFHLHSIKGLKRWFYLSRSSRYKNLLNSIEKKHDILALKELKKGISIDCTAGDPYLIFKIPQNHSSSYIIYMEIYSEDNSYWDLFIADKQNRFNAIRMYSGPLIKGKNKVLLKNVYYDNGNLLRLDLGNKELSYRLHRISIL